MAIYLLLKEITDFVEAAMVPKLEFHRSRKEMHDNYSRAVRVARPNKEKFVQVNPTLHVSILSALLQKNETFDNNALLSFMTAVTQLNEELVKKYGERVRLPSGRMQYTSLVPKALLQKLEFEVEEVEEEDGATESEEDIKKVVESHKEAERIISAYKEKEQPVPLKQKKEEPLIIKKKEPEKVPPLKKAAQILAAEEEEEEEEEEQEDVTKAKTTAQILGKEEVDAPAFPQPVRTEDQISYLLRFDPVAGSFIPCDIEDIGTFFEPSPAGVGNLDGDYSIAKALAQYLASPTVAQSAPVVETKTEKGKDEVEPKTTTTLMDKQQVTNPQSSEVTQTVTHGDNTGHETPGIQLISPITELNTNTDPYPDQGLGPILSRQYLVDTFTWSSASSQGDLLRTLHFPQLLYAVPTIAEKLDKFQFFKAGVKVSLKANGTSFHFGVIQCAWVPHYDPSPGNGIDYAGHMATAANLDFSDLSANTNTVVSFTIPYVAPARYWNMKDDASTDAAGFFGTVWLHNKVPLRITAEDSTASIVVSIFAEFVNPEPAGPCLRDSAAAAMRDRIAKMQLKVDSLQEQVRYLESKTPRTKAQMKSGGRRQGPAAQTRVKYRSDPDEDQEQDLKTEMKDIGVDVVNRAKKGVSNAIVDLSSAGIGALSSLIDPLLGALADKPTDNAPIVKQAQQSQTGLALANGLDGSPMLAMSPNNFIANDHKFFAKKLDYSLFENYKMLPGLVRYGSWIGTDVQNFRPFNIPVTPTICYFVQGVTDMFYHTTHLMNLASYFSYWTGSIKFHVVFNTSKFTTGRVCIKWIPDPTFNAAMTNDTLGDTVSHVIDITGDTSYSFTVPYLQESSWRQVMPPISVNHPPLSAWDGCNGQIALYVINPLVNQNNTGANVVCYYTVYMSGGPDFRCARPNGLWNGYVDGTGFMEGLMKRREQEKKEQKDLERLAAKTNELALKDRTKAQSTQLTTGMVGETQTDVDSSVNIRFLFEKPFPTLIESRALISQDVTMGEEVSSFNELARRYTLVQGVSQNFATTANVYYSPHPVATGDIDRGLRRIRRTFHYSRGSWRNKFNVVGFSTPVIMTATNSANFGLLPLPSIEAQPVGMTGSEIQHRQVRPIIEFQTPFYSDYDMVCQSEYAQEMRNRPIARVTVVAQDGGSPTLDGAYSWWAAIGDDWTFGWPVPPVTLSIPLPEDSPLHKNMDYPDGFIKEKSKTVDPLGVNCRN
jgi:chemotaxis protein histidine kinase CheA